MYPIIGSMAMPAAFKYMDVLRRGKPRHEKFDSFWRKHPPMEPGRWAKIFAPFDALEGFDERISEKEEVYCERKILDEWKLEELNRRMGILHNLTRNGRMARENGVRVAVTYFSPRTDASHPVFETVGKYETISGTVLRVGMYAIAIQAESGDAAIRFADILNIEGSVFDEG